MTYDKRKRKIASRLYFHFCHINVTLKMSKNYMQKIKGKILIFLFPFYFNWLIWWKKKQNVVKYHEIFVSKVWLWNLFLTVAGNAFVLSLRTSTFFLHWWNHIHNLIMINKFIIMCTSFICIYIIIQFRSFIKDATSKRSIFIIFLCKTL